MQAIKKILIIEDEEVNAQRLQRLLFKIKPDFQVLDVLPSIKKTIDWFSSNDEPDLVFMDIRLSDGISFEIFNLSQFKSPVIFTTAYDEYAVQAFKFNSVDYLLKPIEKDELQTAINKYETIHRSLPEQNARIEKLLKHFDKTEYRTRFLLPYRDGYKTLPVNEVAYFFSEYGATNAVSFNGEKNTVSDTLETLEQQLDPALFFRANRQYIIHINSIEKIHNYFNSKLKLDIKQSKEGVIVSRLKSAALKEWLDY